MTGNDAATSAPRDRHSDSEPGPLASIADVAARLRDVTKVMIAVHENPDGDAIGCARAAEVVLDAMGVDVVTWIPHQVIPREYEMIRPRHIVGEVPADFHERTLLCLDSASSMRIALPVPVSDAREVINVDHHADNTCYGDLNVVTGDAACAAELVWALAKELEVPLTQDLATAVYVGLVTDTGRFQYSNTSSESLRLAGELIDAGVNQHAIFRDIFERTEYKRLKLLGRGLEKATSHASGRIVATHLSRGDFDEIGADDDAAEGIVDALRSVENAYVAVFVRDLDGENGHARKGSLRTTRGDIDVSAIARTWGGGGHRQAAGFNTADDMPTIIRRVETALEEQGH
jgi:phosphoesterase RecJ-like protein